RATCAARATGATRTGVPADYAMPAHESRGTFVPPPWLGPRRRTEYALSLSRAEQRRHDRGDADHDREYRQDHLEPQVRDVQRVQQERHAEGDDEQADQPRSHVVSHHCTSPEPNTTVRSMSIRRSASA